MIEHLNREYPGKPLLLAGLGYWNIYFLLKFALYFQDIIDLHPIENLAFVAFLVLPFSSSLAVKLKHIAAVPMASLLLHYDSWLPPLNRLFADGSQLQNFNLVYLMELLGRFIDWQIVASGLILIVGFLFFIQWIRFTTVTIIGFLYILFSHQGLSPTLNINQRPVLTTAVHSAATSPANIMQYPEPEQALQAFYRQQSQLQTTFPAKFKGESFDIVMLNICSLGWADMTTAGISNHPLFSQFDIVFSQFNSATSYSGPAAIRLLKASCGQASHPGLYQASNNQCYLFDNLNRLGFQTDFAMNHNGQFDDFIGVVTARGHIKAQPLSLQDADITQYSFDGTPIYSDLNILSNWWLKRNQDNSQRTALYYNSISLHDGNKLANAKLSFNSIKNYQPRANGLFNDISKFINQLENSGRNVVLLLVPEHGASLTGDKMQIAGMREIPGPSIVDVPVGIKFIGQSISSRTEPLVVEQPSSYLAISQLLANVVRDNPYNHGHLDLGSIIADLPMTPMVAENKNTVMLMKQGKPYIKLDDEWMLYPGY